MNFKAKVGVLATTALVLCVVMLTRGLFLDGSPPFGQNAAATGLQTVPSVPSPIADTTPARNKDESLPTKAAQQNSSTKQLASLPSSQPDMSVVGTAFSVSASVEASCKRKDRDLCERQHHALAEMAEEPRDEAWATKAETLIQDEVMTQGSGIYSIRNIECRSSICAVEVESSADAYVGATYNFLASNHLVDGLRIVGVPETDDLGHQISVALVIFVKSSHYL